MPSEVRPQLLPSPPPLHDSENHVAFKPLDTAEDELGDSKGFSQVPEFLSCLGEGEAGAGGVAKEGSSAASGSPHSSGSMWKSHFSW